MSAQTPAARTISERQTLDMAKSEISNLKQIQLLKRQKSETLRFRFPASQFPFV
jgi:hypothetical protein